MHYSNTHNASTAVARFWACRLVKTPVPAAPGGYEYWDMDDCTGDEG